MKKIAPLAISIFLIGCANSHAIKKEGVALGFQRVKTDDPAFLKADLGGRLSDSSETPASPATVGAATGATVAVAANGATIGKSLMVAGSIAPPVLAVTAVAAGIGAATAALASALAPDTDCGDGWALFTIKTAEGEIKTIRQPRYSVCKFKSGDVVQYLEDDTAILVLKKSE